MTEQTAAIADAPVAHTAQGALGGMRAASGLESYFGIPYAAPPVGALRFRPPQPPATWQGERDATKPGAVAPQEQPATYALPHTDEDCLFLNIWTPGRQGRRPVLFYIHGGAFISGSGSSPNYDGSRMAEENDVVVVTINYRLGVLGFPPFHVFGPETPGNLGLLDQAAALEWVRDNIATFGGDPDNVTIYGYSAGGWCVAALMAMPQARGLFHRAAPQSGAFMYAMTPEAQDVHARTFLAALELETPDAAMLQALPISELLRAQATVIAAWQTRVMADQTEELNFPFTPTRDGITLRGHPIAAIKRGDCVSVPVLVGSTQDELGAAPFRLALEWMRAIMCGPSIRAAIAKLSSSRKANAIWDGYAALHPTSSDATLAGFARSDWQYRVPAIRVAEAGPQFGSRTWMYRFELGAAAPRIGGVATHATDTRFWFGTMAGSTYQDFFFERAPPPAELDLSRQMRADLAQFARSGTCHWPAYESGRRGTMCYAETSSVIADPAGAERALWDGVV
ncbi:MAG TPA: carboxylesterase family protein [Rhizomicrobium sp.]